MLAVGYPYREFVDLPNLPWEFSTGDHLDGFELDHSNRWFDTLNAWAGRQGKRYRIHMDLLLPASVTSQYPNIGFNFDLSLHHRWSHFDHFQSYRTHPEFKPDNFLCTFNGSGHVGRQLLLSSIHRRGWFNPQTCSKNFIIDQDKLDGHIQHYMGDKSWLYRKFFLPLEVPDFFTSIYSLGLHGHDLGKVNQTHDVNVHLLNQAVSTSFVNVVSECMATSYVPYVTEKFVYSIVNRGLFVAYAQPGWHRYIRDTLGFKLYTKLFDYAFDDTINPVMRLIEMQAMLAKFSIMNRDEWMDLYQHEIDTIEFNIDHFFSRSYLEPLTQAMQQLSTI